MSSARCVAKLRNISPVDRKSFRAMQVLTMLAVLSCSLAALRVAPAAAQVCDTAARTVITRGWNSVRLGIGLGDSVSVQNRNQLLNFAAHYSTTEVVSLRTGIQFFDNRGGRASLPAVRVGSRPSQPNFIVILSGSRYYRLRATFRGLGGEVIHRAVQCGVGEISGADAARDISENYGERFMCEWPLDGTAPTGGTSALSPYFVQRLSMVKDDGAARYALAERSIGRSLTATEEFIAKLIPDGGGDNKPLYEIAFDSAEWMGSLRVGEAGFVGTVRCQNVVVPLPISSGFTFGRATLRFSPIVAALSILLPDFDLTQSAPGESVQTVATVLAQDQFRQIIVPTGLRLRVITDDGTVVMMTEELQFNAVGEAETTLEWTPASGEDQRLTVEAVNIPFGGEGVLALPERVDVTAAEILDSLSIAGPTSPTQQVAGQPLRFDVIVTAAGNKGTQPFQPSGAADLQLQHTVSDSAVTVDYEPVLMFAGGVATVSVTATPVPGVDAQISFSLGGVPAGVDSDTAELTVVAAEILTALELSLPAGSLLQQAAGEALRFDVTVTATGSKGTQPFQPSGAADLQLQHTASDSAVTVDYEPVLMFAGGVATASVTVTPLPGVDALISFSLGGVPAGVDSGTAELTVVAVEILTTLELSLSARRLLQQAADEALRFDVTVTGVSNMGTRPFQPQQELDLRLQSTVSSSGVTVDYAPMLSLVNGVATVSVTATPLPNIDAQISFSLGGVPMGVDSGTAELSLVAVEFLTALEFSLPAGMLLQQAAGEVLRFDVTVIGVSNKGKRPFQPQQELDLRLLSAVSSSGVTVDYEPMLSLVNGVTTVSVTATPLPNVDAQINFSLGGVPEGVDSGTAELTVVAAEFLTALELSLPAGMLLQQAAGEALRFEVTVTGVSNKGMRPFQPPEELDLRLLSTVSSAGVTADYEPMLSLVNGVTTVSVTATPLPNVDAQITFSLGGVPEGVDSGTAELTVVAAEFLTALELSLPAEMLLQRAAGEALRFAVTVTGVSNKGTRPFQPQGELDLRLQSTVSSSGVTADYEPVLMFGGGISTVSVTVTPLPGAGALISFSLGGVPVGVEPGTAELTVVAAEFLTALELNLSAGSLFRQAADAPVRFAVTVIGVSNMGTQPFQPQEGLGLRLQSTVSSMGVTADYEPVLMFADGVAMVSVTATPLPGIDALIRFSLGGVPMGVDSDTAELSLVAAEILTALDISLPAGSLPQQAAGAPLRFDVTVTATGNKGTRPHQPWEQLDLQLQHTASSSGVTVDYAPMLSLVNGVATLSVTVTPLPGIDALIRFSLGGVPMGVDSGTAELSLVAAEFLTALELSLPAGMLPQQAADEPLRFDVTVTATGNKGTQPFQPPEELDLRLQHTVSSLGVTVDYEPMLSLVNGVATLSVTVTPLPGIDALISFSLGSVPVGVDSGTAELSLVAAEFLTALELSLPAGMLPQQAADGPVRFDVTVTGVSNTGKRPFQPPEELDLRLLSTVSSAGVTVDYAPMLSLVNGVATLSVTVTPLPGAGALISFSLDGVPMGVDSGTAELSLVAAEFLTGLEVTLSTGSLLQQAAGEPLRFDVTVAGVSNKGTQPFQPPEGLDLRLQHTVSTSGVTVDYEPVLMFVGGISTLSVTATPLPGAGALIRFSLDGVPMGVDSGTAELSLVAAEFLTGLEVTLSTGSLLQQAAGEALRFDVTVTGVSNKGTRLFQPPEELDLRLQHTVSTSGVTVDYEPVLMFVGGVSTLSVTATPLPGAGALIRFSLGGVPMGVDSGTAELTVVAAEILIADGGPAGSSVPAMPADTAKVSLMAKLDVDDNEVFDARDAVLIMKAAADSLPASMPEGVRARLGRLNQDRQDMRLDVDGNGVVDPIDMRVLLRYSAGLRGGSLMEGAADTEAIERRARALLDLNR